MHAHALQRLLRGRSGHVVRRLFRFAGVDLRRCLCTRCIAARSGLFLRTRAWTGRRAYADVYLLGIRISHRFAFEMPATRADHVRRRGGGRRFLVAASSAKVPERRRPTAAMAAGATP